MSRGTPQLVVAHHSAKFSCCGQYFMFGPPSHAFVSLLACACFVFVKISLYLNTLWAWHACFVPGWTDRQHMQCCLRNQPLAPVVSRFSSASADRSCQQGGQLARHCPSFFTNLVGILQQSQAGLEFYFFWIASCRCLGNALGTLQGPLPWKRRTFFWPEALTATLSMCICIMVVLTIFARLLITRIRRNQPISGFFPASLTILGIIWKSLRVGCID